MRACAGLLLLLTATACSPLPESVTLPLGFRPTGISQGKDSGDLLLWGRGQTELFRVDADRRLSSQALSIDASKLLAVAFDENREVLWIDSTGVRTEPGASGAVKAAPQPLPSGILRFESAILHRGRWLATSVNRDSSTSLWMVSSPPVELLRIRSEHAPLHPFVERSFVATIRGNAAVVSRYYPFRAFLMDSTLAVSDSILFPIAPEASVRSVKRNNAALFAIAAIELGTTVRLSLSDPFSLRRVVLSSDARQVENTDGRTLLIRQSNGTEVSIVPVSRDQSSLHFRSPQ